MKVKCVFQQGDPVPKALFSLGYTPTSRFNVVMGRVYTVYSMSSWSGVIHYLLVNDQTEKPDWFPSFLFQIIDHQLPSNWGFTICDLSVFAVDALWGYPEILRGDGTHYIGLIERELAALRTFDLRRAEIDEEASSVS